MIDILDLKVQLASSQYRQRCWEQLRKAGVPVDDIVQAYIDLTEWERAEKEWERQQ